MCFPGAAAGWLGIDKGHAGLTIAQSPDLPEGAHAMQTAIDPQHVTIIEPVRGSKIPVQLMYVEMIDGVYAPIGLRIPPGEGPFPLILFAAGNGGGGMGAGRGRT